MNFHKRIDFAKLKKFASENNVSEQKIKERIGMGLNDWQSLQYPTESERYFEIVILEVFKADGRFFLINTLKTVVDDLVELSWDNNRNIDKEHIVPDEISELVLTQAECILLYEGTQTGIADCTIQAHNKYEYYSYDSQKSRNLIRSEILEWLLSPPVTKLFFKAGGLTIIGVDINDTSLSNPFAVSISKPLNRALSGSLKLIDTILTIDLKFEDCQFNNDIRLDNSVVQSIFFNRCLIKGRFIGNNLVANGDISFYAVDKASNKNLPTNIIEEEKDVYDVEGGVFLISASIAGQLSFLKNFIIKGPLNLYGLSCTSINGNSLKILKRDKNEIYESVSLENANITGNISLHEAYFEIEFLGDALKCERLDMTSCTVLEQTSLSYAEIRYLNFMNASLLGTGVSLNASGLNSSAVFLNDGFLALHGVYLHSSNISMELDCSNSFIGASTENDDIAFTFSKSKAVNVSFKSALVLGRIYMQRTFIESQLHFSSGVFISGQHRATQITNKSIDCKYIKVGRLISFKPEINTINAYSSILNTYLKITELKTGIKNLIDSKENRSELNNVNEQLDLQKDLERREKTTKKYEQLIRSHQKSHTILSSISTSSYYGDHYSLVVGETSFEFAEVEGSVDFAGSLLHATGDDKQLFYPKNTFIADVHSVLNNYLIGKLIVVSLLFPFSILLAIYKVVYELIVNLAYNSKSEKRKKIIKIIKDSTVDDWLRPKVVNWPNALTLSYLRLNGDIFLNYGNTSKQIPFKAVGEVDLKSAKVDNLFLSPDIGSDPLTRWKITGLKYDFIYADISEHQSLDQCEWFYDYVYEENYKQPYEQLSAAYVKMGNDTNARKVLMKTPGKYYSEKVLMAILSLFAWLSLPPYRALLSIVVLWLVGSLIFLNSVSIGEIVPNDQKTSVQFLPFFYSFQLLIPFIPTPQKEAYIPSYKDIVHLKYIPYRPSFVPDFVPHHINFTPFYAYHTFHSIMGTILISLFLLGIARIIKNS